MKYIVLLISLVSLSSGYSLVRHGKVCQLCMDTLEEVKSATTSAQVEKLVTDLATEVCAFAPKEHRANCKDFVSKVMKNNFDMIREFTELWGPEDVCQIVQLCPKSDVRKVEGEVCTLCTDVVGVVRYLLTDPTLKTMIKSYAETVCSATGPLAPLCKREVDQLVDLAFSELKTLFDNLKDEDVCKALHLCKTTGFELITSSAASSSPSPVYSAICEACTATVDEIENLLVMDELEKLLEDISSIACSLLPFKPASQTCGEFTQDLLEEVFYNLKQILKEYDGDRICHIAHLCQSDRVYTSGLELASPTPLCRVCEDALHLTRAALTDPALEVAVKADIKLACSFTGFLHKQCEQYADAFVSSLFGQDRKSFDQFDDHNTCVLFDFCADSGNTTTVCDVCKDAYTEVVDFLTNGDLKKLIVDEVDLACRASGPLNKICAAEANKVIDIVFNVIDKVFETETADKFCHQIHLCLKSEI